MIRQTFNGTAIVSVVLAAACGGGGSSSSAPPTASPTGPIAYEIPVTEQLARLFADVNGDGSDIDDAGQIIVDGKTLAARSVGVAGVNLDYGGNGVTSLAQSGPGNSPPFKIRRAANGELEFELNGVLHTFTASDRVVSGGRLTDYNREDNANSIFYNLYNVTGDLEELFGSGNGYHEVLVVQSNIANGGQPDLRAFAIVGAETRDAALPKLGTAKFTGGARMDIYPTTGFVNNSSSRSRINSDVSMVANFGGGTISGAMTNISLRRPGETDFTPRPGTWVMEKAPFAVNGFTGKLMPDADYLAASPGVSISNTSSYSGAFYGPAAEEVGGVLSISGVGQNGIPFNGVGAFSATR